MLRTLTKRTNKIYKLNASCFGNGQRCMMARWDVSENIPCKNLPHEKCPLKKYPKEKFSVKRMADAENILSKNIPCKNVLSKNILKWKINFPKIFLREKYPIPKNVPSQKISLVIFNKGHFSNQKYFPMGYFPKKSNKTSLKVNFNRHFSGHLTVNRRKAREAFEKAFVPTFEDKAELLHCLVGKSTNYLFYDISPRLDRTYSPNGQRARPLCDYEFKVSRTLECKNRARSLID